MKKQLRDPLPAYFFKAPADFLGNSKAFFCFSKVNDGISSWGASKLMGVTRATFETSEFSTPGLAMFRSVMSLPRMYLKVD